LPELSQSTDVFVVALGETAQKPAFKLLCDLRAKSIKASMDFAGRSLKAQMKQANKAMARYVVMLGEDEVNDSCVILKDMITSDQEKIAIQEVVNKLYAEVKD